MVLKAWATSSLGASGTGGHDVDPVDELRLASEAGLDISDERGDLAATEIVGDVDARQHPYLVRPDIGHQQLADRGDPGVSEEEAPHAVSVAGRDGLTDEKVVVAPHQAEADADQDQRD